MSALDQALARLAAENAVVLANLELRVEVARLQQALEAVYLEELNGRICRMPDDEIGEATTREEGTCKHCVAIWKQVRAALGVAADTETPGHLYNGSFELSWLADDEMVLSAGDGSGACEIAWEPDGRLLCRLEVGDRLKRGEDGRPIAIRPAGAEQQT